MDRLVHGIYRATAALIACIPLRAAWWIGFALGGAAWLVAAPYRRLALRNLRIAFGSEKTERELRAIAWRHFTSLGANLFAGLKIPHIPAEALDRIARIEGLEHMAPQRAQNGGFVFVISHLGNWELFAELAPRWFRCPTGTVYQALGNPLIDAEVRKRRALRGLHLFERKEGFGAATKFLREGGAVGVLIDQHAGDAGLWCPFFGRLASTSTLAATLALRSRAVLIPAAVYSDGPGRWRCILGPPLSRDSGDVDALTVQLNEVLEGQIRVQPHDWFWVHNRWKTPKPNFLLARYKRGCAGTPTKPFRILIRSTNWLGDAVMTIPAVRAIKRGRPDAEVTILAPAKLADLWRAVAEVDATLAIEPGESIFALAARLRHRFDAAVLFPNSLRSALEAWLAGIPRRAGYRGHHRAWLLDQIYRRKKHGKSPARRPEAASKRHQVFHYLDLAEQLGADVAGPLLPPARPRPANLRPIAGLCPGAEYGPAKRWLPERFAEVMRTVADQTGCQWRIFGVAKDRPIADAILSRAGVPCEDRVGKTSLAGLIDELAQCDALLTNDTGTMHLAAFLGVPVAALFGSTEPALTGPLGDGHIVLREKVDCSPCFLRECPIDFPCMKAITTEAAATALKTLLARGAAR
jgi:lipopolysaccharide heptosyltransferase II